MKKSLKKSALVAIASLMATGANAYIVYNPKIEGDGWATYGTARIFSYNVPSGHCDGHNLEFDIDTQRGAALFQTYITLRANNKPVKAIRYHWDREDESCYVDGIKFD